MAEREHGDSENRPSSWSGEYPRRQPVSGTYAHEIHGFSRDPSTLYATTQLYSQGSGRTSEPINANPYQRPLGVSENTRRSDRPIRPTESAHHVGRVDFEEGVSSSQISKATIENARCLEGREFQPDHPNEDEHFVISEQDFKVFGVLDGHGAEGLAQNVAKFAREKFCSYFRTNSWRHVIHSSKSVPTALTEFFRSVEADYFDSIKGIITENERLKTSIPSTMRSQSAALLYPDVVLRIQQLEPLISGGCTAVVAVVCGNKLYVANVGDSRAVVIYQTPNGTLETLQLSTDHDVKNEDELTRLEQLGLDPEELKRAGRLGPQENTRSIGDYNIKGGYKSVDILRCANSPPGTAEPSIRVVDLEASDVGGRVRYLILMSDGVYKGIEAQFDNVASIESNKIVAAMVEHCMKNCDVFSKTAQDTLDRLVHVHRDKFFKSAHGSPRALACCKRDDMTLLVYRFT